MGRDPKARPLTRLELEMMKALWEGGPGTVEAVRERLAAEPRLAYTTVQTMLNVLFRKGKVKRRLAGRAFEYRPVMSRAKAARVAIRDLIDRLFGGSAESLVMNLVETRELTPDTLSRLNKTLKQSEAIRREKEALHGND